MLYSQCTQAPARDTAKLAYIALRKSTLHFWNRFVHSTLHQDAIKNKL